MQLFLDSNVYLSFFKRSSDDLKKLEEITEYVNDGGLDLFIPENVVIEFYRNREKVIADELKHLTSQISNKFQLPRMADGNPLTPQIKDISVSRNKLIEDLSNELKEAASSNTLPADTVIKNLFNVGRNIPISDDILAKAKNRVELNNPPGKPGSIGDAINWECLLDSCGDYELHVVTRDSDFQSPLNDQSFHEFLLQEWRAKSNHPLYLHKHLGDFLRQHLPDYALNYDKLSEYWIGQLEVSTDIKLAVNACEHIEGRDLSYEQSQQIIDNPNVDLIYADVRIKRFYEYILHQYGVIERPEYHELADILYDTLNAILDYPNY